MKNELPPVTATYFITLIKSYLQGARTRQEIMDETADLLELSLPGEPTPANITNLLIITASKINPSFYQDIVDQVSQASDTTPTRNGLLHHLETCVNGDISPEDLLEWATTWQDEEEPGVAYFEDPAVEYCCLLWLPAQKERLSRKLLAQALEIFHLNCGNPLKEKIALVLLSEQEQQRFLFFLRDYADHRKTAEELDLYLLRKFGMDHRNFPYMPELVQVAHKQAQLEDLLKKARLINNE
ncbi:hypothetical protein [Chitinophaga japonensis]|uniref:Uncharacterized protein n=1 Tax=Chitinophaga japonensis TaxID=104662 RepID=A0A562T6K4_CHIJA|nr:hypothetical protein [Chitinophaga japonensis]TWI88716.1 hypothetical protein LX66_2802 [Chitinophaga japonensis]